MRTAHGRRALLGLTTVGLVAALAGCGGSAPDSGSTNTAAAPAQREGMADQGAKAGTGPQLPVKALAETRSIIYKGEVTIRTRSKVDEAAAKASTIATGAGGVIAGDNRRNDGDDATADLVLRIPSAAFYSTVNKLADELGDELSRGISTDDVTEAVVDLDARIAGQKASVDRTRALLSRAQQISDIVTIEQELARREGELASLQARKRTLSDQVTLSTITVHLIGPKTAAPAAKDAPKNFLTGLAAGWDAFTTTVNGALIVLGAVLPFLVALGIPVAVLVWLLRRRRPQPATRPAPAPES
jgi:hypothetical protein